MHCVLVPEKHLVDRSDRKRRRRPLKRGTPGLTLSFVLLGCKQGVVSITPQPYYMAYKPGQDVVVCTCLRYRAGL
ncbi:hypothetical protein LY76DRAFT_590564, partial [Colletotrichum caudatum]